MGLENCDKEDPIIFLSPKTFQWLPIGLPRIMNHEAFKALHDLCPVYFYNSSMTIFPLLSPPTKSNLWPWRTTSPNSPCSLHHWPLFMFPFKEYLVPFLLQDDFLFTSLSHPILSEVAPEFLYKRAYGGTLKGKKTGDLSYNYICITKTHCYWDYKFHLVHFGGPEEYEGLKFLNSLLDINCFYWKSLFDTPQTKKVPHTIVHFPLLENLHCIRDVVYLSLSSTSL